MGCRPLLEATILNYLIKCSNVECKFCATDDVTGKHVCSDIPDLMHWVYDNHGFTVRCKQFQPTKSKPPVQLDLNEPTPITYQWPAGAVRYTDTLRAKLTEAIEKIDRLGKKWVDRIEALYPVDEANGRNV